MWSTGLAGGTRAIFEIANRLSDRGYNVNIIALGGDHRWFKVRVPVNYVDVPRTCRLIFNIYKLLTFRWKHHYDSLNIEGIAKRLGFHADLIRILSENIPSEDILIATYFPTAIAAWLSGGDKLFYFLQDFPELVEEAHDKYLIKLFEASLRLPFIFLCNSSYTCEIVLSRNPNAKTYVTGVGVDTEVFRPRSTKLNHYSRRKVVMAILRGFRYKGDEIALNALNLINKHVPIYGVFVGNDKVLRRISLEFPYTHYRYVDDETLAKLYSSSDLFIFTSYAEGFGLPPLEAMACGTPVVMTDAKGNRDYAINGYNCILVPPGDPKAVAEASIKVLTDDKLRERLIEGGLETAKKWSWNRVVDVFERALRENI